MQHEATLQAWPDEALPNQSNESCISTAFHGATRLVGFRSDFDASASDSLGRICEKGASTSLSDLTAEGSSVNWQSPAHGALFAQARWDLAPLLISANRQNCLRKVGGPSFFGNDSLVASLQIARVW